MLVDLHIHDTFSMKMGAYCICIKYRSGHPAQSMQADLGRFFIASVSFMKGLFFPVIHLVVLTESRISKAVTKYRPKY